MGSMFKVTVAGGSYQEGMTVHMQGVAPGLLFTEEEIYRDLLCRKPGQGELTSPRMEPDIPILYSGFNVADTMEGFHNKGLTNGTPLVILIPNLDRHFIHIEQYRSTNRTPRPGHASLCSFQKYGPNDDAIGAGLFSGRYTCTLVAAGVVAKRILSQLGIQIVGYVREAAGIVAPDVPLDLIQERVAAYKQVRREYDLVYQAMFGAKRIHGEMRFLEKMQVLSQYDQIMASSTVREMDVEAIKKERGIHPILNCPDLEAAQAMYDRIVAIRDEGDSSGGVVEVVATGCPPGLGEPVFDKLDGELGRMMSIGGVKAVEIGSGVRCKNMKGSEQNDQMRDAGGGRVKYLSNQAGGMYGGLASGEPIVARLAVKPTPTIGKDQQTVDKVTCENTTLSAVTRRDPTLVARIWPVAEAHMAILLLDLFMKHVGYQELCKRLDSTGSGHPVP